MSRADAAGSMSSLIASMGYLAVFVGVWIEGEAVVLVAGYLGARGVLDPFAVFAAAFAGSVAVYNFCFWLGRRHGRALLDRRPHWRTRVAVIERRIRHHRVPLILGYRLLFGLRAATPFALGVAGVPQRRFLLLDTPVALAWAAGLTAAGYVLGEAVHRLAERVSAVTGWVSLGVLVVAVALLVAAAVAYRRRVV